MLHTGKLDHIPDSRDLQWADIRPSGLVVPSVPKPHGGFGMDFHAWGMLGNGPQDDNAYPADWAAAGGAGDCTIADALHAVKELARNAGRPIPTFTTRTAIEQYAILVGETQGGMPYDPQTGANDTGLQIRDVMRYGQQVGFADAQGNRYKRGPYVALQPGNLAEMWEVLWFAEHVTIGVQIQQQQVDDFKAGRRLIYNPASPIVGGHDELIVGHPRWDVWTGVMWGQRFTMNPQVIAKTCDEAWSYFDPEQISATTGKSYEGYDPALLQEYLATIANQLPVR